MRLRHSLRDLLKSRKMTIKQLADQSGVAASTIKTWLAGSTPRSMDDLRTVARIFDVSLDFLLFGEADAADRHPGDLSLEQVFTGWLLVDVKRAVPLKKGKKNGHDD
jgi:transcriptional regulator with XRE-family HTH domain